MSKPPKGRYSLACSGNAINPSQFFCSLLSVEYFALPADYLGFYTKAFVVFDILNIKNSFGRVETSSFQLKTIFRQHPETLFFDDLLINLFLIIHVIMIHFISAVPKCISTRKLKCLAE